MTITCSLGGWLVNAEGWMPSAPFDFSWGGLSRPVIGCNNLRCRECGQPVRSWAGFTIDGSEFDPASLPSAPAEQPTGVTGVEPSSFERLYACRCRWWAEASESATEHADRDHREPYAAWACAGHPPVDLQDELDGDAIDEANASDTVRRRLANPGDGLPDGLTLDQVAVPSFWVVRLHRLAVAAGHSAVADEVESCVASLVSDESAVVRLGALSFAMVTPASAAADTLVAAVADDPGLFVGEANWGDQTWDIGTWTAEAMLRAWGDGREPAATAARDAVRRLAVTPGGGYRELILPLATRDPEWFENNALALATATPGQLTTILRELELSPVSMRAELVRELVAAGALAMQDAAERIHALPGGSAKDELLEALGLPT